MAGEKKAEAKTGFFSSPRRIGYACLWALIFAIAASALGLVSQQLHNNGNGASNYPSAEYYHVLGLILFSCIFTFLLLIAHPFAALGVSSFFAFVGAVFWGTSAGVLWQVTPFSSRTCGNPAESFEGRWGEIASQCSRVVAIEGLSWTLWALFVILFCATLVHKVEFRPRPNASFYGA